MAPERALIGAGVDGRVASLETDSQDRAGQHAAYDLNASSPTDRQFQLDRRKD